MDEAIAHLQDPATRFDVFFPTIDAMPGLIDAGLLRPSRHDLLPNLRNLWPWFRGGGRALLRSRAAIPLPRTVGSGSRGARTWSRPPTRQVTPRIRGACSGTPSYQGRVGMYDGYLEAMSLALLRDGVADVRAATDAELEAAVAALVDAVAITGVRFTNDGAQEGLPEGEFAVHQAWSRRRVVRADRYAAAEGGLRPREEAAVWSPARPREDRGVRSHGDLRAWAVP